MASLDSLPSRYPNWGTLNGLGIQQSWDVLVQAGHLQHLFSLKLGSYKALTVEFFTTLTVESSGRNIKSMSFRLVNEEHTISVEEFNELFQLMEEGEEDILKDP